MLINIELFREPIYDCLQILVASLAIHNNRCYEMISLGRLGFKYTKNDKNRIGDKLYMYGKLKYYDMLSDYHGIEAYMYTLKNKELIEWVINKINNNTPLIIESDTFWCPWSSAFQKKHVEHYFLFIGYDLEKRIFICLDPLITQNYVEIRFDDMKNIIKNIIELNYEKEQDNSLKLYTALANDMDHYLDQKNMFSLYNIFVFLDDLKNKLNISTEISGYEDNINSMPIIENLWLCCTNRYSYGRLIEYICKVKKNDELLPFSNAINNSANEWAKIRNQFIKLFTYYYKTNLLNENLLTKIFTNINECAINEIEFALKLRNAM